MKTTDQLLVFLRSHNEVDQIVPVLYKLGERNEIVTDVVLSSNVPQNDFRLAALKNFDNISIYPIGGTRTLGGHVIGTIKKLGRKLPTDVPEELYRKHSSGLQAPVELDLSNYTTVAFDWSLAKHHRTDYLAESDKHTTIVFPHGDSPFTNRLIKTSKFNKFLGDPTNFSERIDQSRIGFRSWQTMTDFDYLLFPNKATASRIEKYDESDHVRVLGSPRYNREWLRILSEISPDAGVESSELNLVMFLRRERYNVSKSEVINTMSLLSRFPGLRVIVKEHPRDRLLDPSVADGMDALSVVGDEIPSASLVRWADAFLSLGTTVVFDPVMRWKPVMELEYAHANHTIVAEYFPEADVRCKDDLYQLIHDFREGDTDEFYTKDAHQRFVEEMITNREKSVLDTWAECIESIVQQSTQT